MPLNAVMTNTIYSPKERMYRDIDGTLCYISPCSIVDRERLRLALNELMTVIGQHPDRTASFEQLYVTDAKVRKLVRQIGQLAKFDPEKLTGAMLFAMVFPHESDELDEDGNRRRTRSILAQLNDFTYSDVGLSDPRDVAREYYKLIAVLWETNKDLAEALRNAKDVPADVLLESLEELSLLRGGEEAYKRKMKQKAEEDLKKLTAARKTASQKEGETEDIGW